MTTTMSKISVQERAYELFLERGGMHGSDQDDWYRAETELLGNENGKKATATKAARKPRK